MTQPVSTHRATNENGPPVVNGKLIWTSASGITTADPRSFGGCLRRFWLEKVAGHWAPETKSQRGGTELHSEVEARLTTGASLQTPLALSGGIFIPQPGQGLLVEKPIHFKTKDGVDIHGHVDLYNLRQQYIDSSGTLQQDPPWSFEVKDWKTTSSFEYAKSELQLAENIQLNTYAEAGFRMWPDFEHSRFTHVYFRTRGKPESKLVTIRRTRREVEARWDYAEAVIRTMADAAKETSQDNVEANRSACTAYRGCPHQGYCTAYGKTSLDSLYNKIAGDWNNENGANVEQAPIERTPPQMGLIANNPQMMQQPAQQQPQPDMRQQLAAEEAQMRQAMAQQQQRPSLPDAWAQIEQLLKATGRTGVPALGGAAAQAMAQARGWQLAMGSGYAGSGSMAGVQLMTVDHLYQLLGELQREAGQAQQPPQQQQMPQVAQQPQQQVTQNFQGQLAQAYTQQTGQPIPQQMSASILPPGAPESMPQLAMQQPKQPDFAGYQMPQQTHSLPTNQQMPTVVTDPTPTTVLQQPPAEEPAKGRGRPKKNKARDTAPEVVAAVAAPASTPPSSVGTPVTQAPPAMASTSESGTEMQVQAQYGQPTIILINARRAGVASKSLADYVDFINAKLAQRYSVNDDGSPGIQDVRAAPKNSVLAFGGWKGAVREVVKLGDGLDGLEGMTLHLDTFMDELNEAVADALRVVAEKRGWIYIRAVR